MARLPSVGGDDSKWGNILNDFLSQEHNPDGTLKIRTDGTIDSKYTKPASGIPASDLHSSITAQLADAQTAVQNVNGKTGQTVSLGLDDLSDVNLAGANDGQALAKSGSSWAATSVIATSQKGVPNGVASLDSDGNVPSSQLPGKTIQVLTQTEYNALPSDDSGTIYGILSADGTQIETFYVGAGWRPDSSGLFGGQQLIGDWAGVFSQAAIGTSGNWGSNDKRATEGEWYYTAKSDATGVRLAWFNDINDQHPPLTISLSVTSGSLGGSFVINSTLPTSGSTSSIAFNASATVVESALESLLGVATGGISVTKTGGSSAPVWTVLFIAPVPGGKVTLSLTTTGLTGTGATGTIDPIVHASAQTQMAIVTPDNTVYALDLRDVAAPSTSLGNGVSTPVTVSPRGGVFGVPSSTVSATSGQTIKGRIFVDRGNDTATNRFPRPARMQASDPHGGGTSQGGSSTPGAGTSHVHNSTSDWSALGYGALGFLAPTAIIGTPTSPIANLLILGDSVENRSNDDTTRPDRNLGYVRRAATTLGIPAMNMAQGNETLQNLRAMLEVTTNVRRKLLGGGNWSHIFIGQARNDVQGARSASLIITDYQAVVALIRSVCPPRTKVYLGTLPPYTDASNVRKQNTIMDDLLSWQLSSTGAGALFDHVFDVGATVASASDRQRWATTALGDPIQYLGVDGIHPSTNGHVVMANVLTADPTLFALG